MKPDYSDEWANVYVGDCAEVLPKLDVQADLILTSPPYGNLRNYGDGEFDFDSVADACIGALADGGVIVWVEADAVVKGSETGDSFRHALGFMDRGLRLHDTMAYAKHSTQTQSVNRYYQAFEFMFVLSKGAPKTFNAIRDKKNLTAGKTVKYDSGLGRRGGTNERDVYRKREHTRPKYDKRSNIWTYRTGFYHASADMPEVVKKHPAVFPPGLARDHVWTWTNPGDLVLDPMCGSGTTLRAAKDLSRKAIGVEIEQGYLPTIIARVAQNAFPNLA